MTDYARCFDEAVASIDRTTQFPGQVIPGMWALNAEKMMPAVIIGVIIADAVSIAAKACDLPFDFVMARYERLMQDQSIEVKGSPDQIARNQLLKAALLERQNAHRTGEEAQITLEDAAARALTVLEGLPKTFLIDSVISDLTTALNASRKTHG